MEINIDTICPKCKQKIHIFSRTSSESIVEHNMSEEQLYNFGRYSSKLAVNKERNIPKSDLFFEDILDIFEDYYKQNKHKAREFVKRHFNKLGEKIKETDDPRKLLNISRKLVKTKVKVSKDILNDVEKNKKKLLDIIQKKVNNSKKKHKKKSKRK